MNNRPTEHSCRMCIFIDNSHLFRIQQEIDLRSKERLRIDYDYLKSFLGGSKHEVDVRFYYSEFVPDDEPEEFSVERSSGRSKIYRFLAEELGFIMIRLRLRAQELSDSLSRFNMQCRSAIQNLVRKVRQHGMDDCEILKLMGQDSMWLQSIESKSYFEERGVDCEIVYDMVALAMQGHYGRFVLVSGSEDFCRTIRKLRTELGMPVDVAFFGSEDRCSNRLKKSASMFIDLEERPSLFRRIPAKVSGSSDSS